MSPVAVMDDCARMASTEPPSEALELEASLPFSWVRQRQQERGRGAGTGAEAGLKSPRAHLASQRTDERDTKKRLD